MSITKGLALVDIIQQLHMCADLPSALAQSRRFVRRPTCSAGAVMTSWPQHRPVSLNMPAHGIQYCRPCRSRG